MGARGTTFAKLDRERSKKAKAAAKRERRAERGEETDEELSIEGDGELAPEELLKLVEQTQRLFDAEEIDFDEYEERKAALLARLTVD